MTSEGLGEMFLGDSAEMCGGKFPLVSLGGRAEGLACADPGARTPIGMSRNFLFHQFIPFYEKMIFSHQTGTTFVCAES